MGRWWNRRDSVTAKTPLISQDGDDVVDYRSVHSDATSISSLSTIHPADGGRQAYLVLMALSLLQVPVWGFVISYGVLQEFYLEVGDHLDGDETQTGIIGTTLNGVMYLAMPFFFGIFAHRYIRYRKLGAFVGIFLSTLSVLLSSYTTVVWQLIVTQGVLQALGSTILYSSTMVYLDEWFIDKKGLAYGVTMAVKSAVGVALPLILEDLLSRVGLYWTLRIWAIVSVSFAVPAIFFLRLRRSVRSIERHRDPKLGWGFLRYRSFWLFQFANIIFSTGYGLPQTYLSAFGSGVLGLSSSDSALVIVALNVPSVAASFWFGALSDGRGLPRRMKPLTISAITFLSAMGATIPAFLFWGLVPGPGTGGVVLLTLFAIFYGFFAGGYSATWGGVVKDMLREAEKREEAIDTGLLFGLLNGGRGVGFLAGGLIGVQLLDVGGFGSFAYGTAYGSLIVFVGITSALGGVSVLFNKQKVFT